MNSTVLKVFVELHKKTGKPFFENLLVDTAGDGVFRLLRSPGFLQGFAAGDLLTIEPTSGVATLVEHGPNACVQYFCPKQAADVARFLDPHLRAWDGRIDGIYRASVVIVTVPIAVGPPAIEALLQRTLEKFEGSSWYFANLYDPVDGKTPLEWWRKNMQ